MTQNGNLLSFYYPSFSFEQTYKNSFGIRNENTQKNLFMKAGQIKQTGSSRQIFTTSIDDQQMGNYKLLGDNKKAKVCIQPIVLCLSTEL